MNWTWQKATAADLDELEKLYESVHDALEAGINHPGWIRGLYPTRQDAEKGVGEGSLFVIRCAGSGCSGGDAHSVGDERSGSTAGSSKPAGSSTSVAGSIILNHEPEQSYDQVPWLVDIPLEQAYVIHTLMIHPAYARTGLGQWIMALAEGQTRADGMRSLRLDVYENNEPAIRLYERCGYQYLADIDIGLAYLGLESLRVYEKLVGV